MGQIADIPCRGWVGLERSRWSRCELTAVGLLLVLLVGGTAGGSGPGRRRRGPHGYHEQDQAGDYEHRHSGNFRTGDWVSAGSRGCYVSVPPHW